MTEDLRHVQLAGPPAAIGAAFGEQFRDDIRDLAERRMAHLAAFVAMHQPGRTVSRDQVLAVARRTLPVHRHFEPAIWAEFDGIARACGLTHESLLVANGLTDLRDLVLRAGPGRTAGADTAADDCTACLVPAACTDGHPILAQTWDMHADAADFLVLVRRRPTEGPGTLGLTTVGCLCLIGLNDAGVAVGNTNLVATDAQAGVNYLFTITRALQCTGAADAAEAVIATTRLSGHNFHIADGRNTVNIECTATRARRTTVTDSPFVHANHYLADELKAHEHPRDMCNTRWRQQALAARLAAAPQPIDADACWSHLAAISQQRVPRTEAGAAGAGPEPATVATVMLRPASGKLDVCPGPSDRGRRQVLTL